MHVRPVRRALVPVLAAALVGAMLASPPANAAPAAVAPRTVSVAPTATTVLPAATRAAHARAYRLLSQRVHVAPLGNVFAGLVTDMASGTAVWRYNSAKPMISASTMKAVTGSLALRAMGGGHRFPTWVYPGATPNEVVLRGGGDPLLTRADLRLLAARTAAALVAGHTGAWTARTSYAVRSDVSLFGDLTVGAGWSGAPGNKVTPFLLERTRESSPATTAGRYFASQLALQITARATAADIPTVGAASFTGFRITAPGATPLASVPGHRLDEAIRTMLWWSDSNIAEILFRQTALASGRPATWAGARSAALTSLRSLGVHLTGVLLVDGSGLSRSNRLTPQLLVDVLTAAQRPAETRMQQIRSLVMTAGKTGTLTTALGRFSTSMSRCAIGKFWGKSGTLDGVITITGYARGADGRTKVLAFMVNERDPAFGSNITRRYIDALVATVVGCY